MSGKSGPKKYPRKKSEGSKGKGDASVVNTVSREESGHDYNLKKNEKILAALNLKTIAELSLIPPITAPPITEAYAPIC